MNEDYNTINNNELIEAQEGARLDTPQNLVNDASAVIDTAEEFSKEVETIYNTIEKLQGNWKGDSATNFYTNMEKFRAEFETFGPACKAIGSTLKEVGEDYVKLEQIM